MPSDEVVLPISRPESEWLLGRAARKVSPTRRYSLLQSELLLRLNRWARGRGGAGAEWRFRLAPPGQVRRPLVPDVSFFGTSACGCELVILVNPFARLVTLVDRENHRALRDGDAIEHVAPPLSDWMSAHCSP